MTITTVSCSEFTTTAQSRSFGTEQHHLRSATLGLRAYKENQLQSAVSQVIQIESLGKCQCTKNRTTHGLNASQCHACLHRDCVFVL